MHLACEQGQKPLSIVITAGQRGDSPQFQAVLERIRVPRPGTGRPRHRPGRVLADKAYGSRANRAYLRRHGIRCTIPEKADQVRHPREQGQRRGAAPPAFDPELYKLRHAVECGIRQAQAQPGRGRPATTSSPSATKPPCASAAINESLALAGQSGDPLAEIEAAHAREMTLVHPDDTAERMRVKLVAERAEALGQPLAALLGQEWRIQVVYLSARLDIVDSAAAAIDRLARRSALPLARWHLHRLHGAGPC